MPKVKVPNVPPERIKQFRRTYNLSGEALDRLLGFSSQGRATRRWEADGAPPYVEVLLRYIEAHGLDIASKLADERFGPVRQPAAMARAA